jgi:phosphatidylserine/phosphatidylglycerophosphate/cardiolipin synthase-like enzyme
LLIDGQQFFDAMLGAIETAESFIFFEQYLVSSGAITNKFIHALTKAAHRDVKVYCLFDDYGCRRLNHKDRLTLLRAGINLHLYNPLRLKHWHHTLFRNHRKLLLIDGETAFVGGSGLTDDFLYINKPLTSWHDVMIKIKGPVLQDWHHLFQTSWHHFTGKNLSIPAPKPQQQPEDQLGQVLINQPLLQNINRSTLKHIQLAKKCIWITTPYFVPTSKLRRRLRGAARKGIDVRLLLSGEHSDHLWVTHAARRYYSRLLRNGVRIFEFQPRFTHAKIVLCDEWVSIGSSNLDRWNQRWNLDANQCLKDKAFSQIVMAMFETDFENSNEIELTTWLQRSFWQRIRECISGYFVATLERISRYFPQR